MTKIRYPIAFDGTDRELYTAAQAVARAKDTNLANLMRTLLRKEVRRWVRARQKEQQA